MSKDPKATPHQAGMQSMGEAFPGGVVGGMIGVLLAWAAGVAGYPMGDAAAASVSAGCAAIGAWLSSYIMARRGS